MTRFARRQAFELLAGVFLVGGLLAAPVAAADPAPPPPAVVGGDGDHGFITVTAESPGSSGASGGGGASAPAGSGSGGGGSFSSPVGSVGGGSGGGGSSGGGYVVTGADNPARALGITDAQFLSAPGFYTRCTPATLPGADPALVASCLTGSPAVPAAPAAPGTPAPPAQPPLPPSAAVVAQIAIRQLDLTAATPHLSADPNLAVGLPVWMWVDQSPTTTGPVSTTATAGPMSVTAVATLSRIDWSMGPAGAVVSCAGPGTRAPAGPIFHGNDSPDCGYTYALRSLPERTGGTGKWPVSATAVWSITWFGAGQAGGQGLSLTSRTAVEVGELQSVFVAPGGGH